MLNTIYNPKIYIIWIKRAFSLVILRRHKESFIKVLITLKELIILIKIAIESGLLL